MPTVTETMIDGYAHCNDGRCMGNKQEPVKVVRTVTEFSYFDLGGDVPGIERSVDSIRFADRSARSTRTSPASRRIAC
jgi:hypothetical protein